MRPDGALELARTGQLYPSVILHGASASRRRDLALELARALLCGEPEAQRPCGDCAHCRRIHWPEDSEAFHPDFAVLRRDLRTVTSVGATKEFLRTAQVSPFEARGQVFVIVSAETLSGEAANALLKTLEEPPTSAPRNFFLLAPSQLDLLPTLRSRSLALFLGSAPPPDRAALGDTVDVLERTLGSFDESRNDAELLAAASLLKAGSGWDDPRAAGPWERAAATVLAVAERRSGLPSEHRRVLLSLALDLLSGPKLRVRGITPARIIEGMLSRHLG